MATNAFVTTQTRFDVERVLSKNNVIVHRTMQRLVDEIDEYVQKNLRAKQFPPAGAPGTYPAKRTEYLADNTEVSAKGRSIVIKTPRYGVWLNTGTGPRVTPPKRFALPLRGPRGAKARGKPGARGHPGMKARPWMDLALFRRRDFWFKRATRIAKELSE